MDNQHLISRALVLMETRRYADAEQMLIKGLVENPQDANALAILALCRISQDKNAEALTPAQQAVAIAPDSPFVLTTLGRALFFNNKPKEAREHLHAALQMDPTFSDAYMVLSQLEYHERNWEMALYNAERGLEHDPEDQSLVNLRAMALVKLNRNDEAAETVDYALYNDPEDGYSHSNKGWVNLHQSKYNEAVASFKEALRLNPNNEHAREGLKEAIKGKNWLYRGLLKYFLFMGRLSERNQWLVIIGLYVGMRFLRSISESNPALQPFIAPLIVAYMVFALATWIGKPLSNLFLRLHPVGKYALTDYEKTISNITGVVFFSGVIAMVASWVETNEEQSFNLSVLALTFLGMLVPIGGLSYGREGKPERTWLWLFAGLMFLIGPLHIAYATFVHPLSVTQTLLSAFAIGIFLYSWVVNAFLSWAYKRF